MALPLVSNIELNQEMVVRLYQFLLGLVVLIQSLFFFRGGYYFKKENNYFLNAPLKFIKKLPTPLHNALLFILPVSGIMVMTGYRPVLIIGCFICAIILFYMFIFCYSVLHHGTFLSSTIFFLSGMFFAFPQPLESNPFLTLAIFQVSAVYLFSGISKLNSQLIRSSLLVDALFDIYKNFLLRNNWMIKPFKFFVIFAEIFLGLAFWFPEFGIQKAAIILGVALHIGMIAMTGRGHTFHILLPVTYILVILKNYSLYESQIIFFLILISSPILFLLLFYRKYNLKVKDYMPDQE